MVEITAGRDLEHARRLDGSDPLAGYREAFHIPPGPNGEPCIYLCGNSLGLAPRSASARVQAELDAWARLGVEGHFAEGVGWFAYHERFRGPAARLVGAREGEVVVMNALTVNLHLLMVSFYRPSGARRKILIERGAFPSDRYAVASQAAFHGLDPADAVIEIGPRAGERTLRTEDILAAIEAHGPELALVMFGGVNYYTGQVLDIAAITEAVHAQGAVVGFDLAHAAGNVPLRLHDDGVDFGAWCSYKYLNAGPGGVAMAFVHERHGRSPELPRFAGWWGNDPGSRFSMPEAFSPQPGAAGWQLSNAPILPMAALSASLEVFDEVGMEALRLKSVRLTSYLQHLLDGLGGGFEVITPREVEARGCQLSLLVDGSGQALHERLMAAGVICDFRRPNVIRVAPVPLYNRFEDVWRFVAVLRATLEG